MLKTKHFVSFEGTQKRMVSPLFEESLNHFQTQKFLGKEMVIKTSLALLSLVAVFFLLEPSNLLLGSPSSLMVWTNFVEFHFDSG